MNAITRTHTKENIIVHRTYPLVFEGKRAPASR